MTGEITVEETRKLKWWHFVIGFGVWTIIGLSFASRSYYALVKQGVPVLWSNIFISYLIDFYLWALVSPLIFRLCRRFPIERERLVSRLLLYLGLALVFVFAVTAVSIPIYWVLGSPDLVRNPTLPIFFRHSIISPIMLHENLVVFTATVIAAHAFEYYHQSKVRKLETAELSAQLARAQLSALKMQLHPHFLFNTLNSIAALLHKDPETADRMLTRLSDFLRMTLKNSETHGVSLEKEMEFLNTYLAIEKLRFQDNLVIETDIAPETREAQVPNLILQPVVENAVRHGLARVTATGILRIKSRRQSDRVRIQIEDNGPGLRMRKSRNGNGDGGVGIANTRARLEQFYGGDFSFEISEKPDAPGTVVTFDVPFME